MSGTAPHLRFNPVTDDGQVHPDILAYAQLFGAPEKGLSSDLRGFLAFAIAWCIGTTPGEQAHIRNRIIEPVGEHATKALRFERRFGLHDEVVPNVPDGLINNLLVLMGAARVSRMRWAHAATTVEALRMLVREVTMVAPRDQFLADSELEDSHPNITEPIPHALPVDLNWQPPDADLVGIGTRSHLARWIAEQSPVADFGEVMYIDARSMDPSRHASTEDGLEAYMKMLADERANMSPELLKDEFIIGIVSSCPHWLSDALAAERYLRDAVVSKSLPGTYRIEAFAYPLDWESTNRVYVLRGLIRAVLQWTMLNRPELVPITEVVKGWAGWLDTVSPAV